MTGSKATLKTEFNMYHMGEIFDKCPIGCKAD